MQTEAPRLEKRSHPLKGKRWSRHFFSATLIIALEVAAISAMADEDAVAAFKKHLSSPPCFSRIIYSEVSCNDTVSRTIYAAYCGDSFFIRQLTGSENIDLPIGASNRNSSPMFVGRMGDARWQIAGFGLTISQQPDAARADPYAGMSDDMRCVVGGIVGLSSQHLVPGSFVWNGNHFKAKASSIAAQFNVQEFEGDITVEGGVVTKMVTRGAGAWTYKYSKSSNVPFGIPSEITRIGRDSPCVSKVVIHEMVPGDPAEELLTFDPKRFFDTNFMTMKQLSRGTIVSQSKKPAALTKMEEDDLKPSTARAQEAAARTAKKRIYLLIVFVALFCSVPLFFLRKKQSEK
jgi:hypothetical protein